MPIDLITFDFWNTLFLDQNEGMRNSKRIAFAHSVLCRYRQDLKEEEVGRAFSVASTDFDRQWKERRAALMDRYVNVLLDDLDLKVSFEDYATMVQFFETVLLEFPPRMIPSALDAVSHAYSRTKVGLICDTGYSPGTTLRRILDSQKLIDYFHSFSFSNETGYLKPRSETFVKVLQELSIDPANAVHIGDLEDTDIAGAKKMGMKAIKYIGSNKEAVRESIADIVIEDLAELPAALDKL